jgi:hypothetical protein
VVRRSERIIDCPVRTIVMAVDCAERATPIAYTMANSAARRHCFIDNLALCGGYIYIVDRANTGMHTLELTGAARRVARF